MNRSVGLIVACAITALMTTSCARPASIPQSNPGGGSSAPLALDPTVAATTSPEHVGASEPASDASTTVYPTIPAGQGGGQSDADAVAIVNGTEITREEYEKQVSLAQRYFVQQPGLDASTEAGAQALGRFREAYLDVLIDQTLIEQAALSLGITVSDPEIEDQIAQMRSDDEARFDGWLETTGLTRETFREQLRREMLTRAVRDLVTTNTPREQYQIHAQHILLADQDSAQAALQRLQAGESFASVAKDLSQDVVTRDNGGDLGFLPLGVMPPSFESAALALDAGQMSGIVESETGLHIILVVEHDPARVVSGEYWPTVQQRVFEDWLESQRQRASIVRNPVSATP